MTTIRRIAAVQGVWSHRHWPLEEHGRFVDHAHAIGKREHAHLSHRLGSVVLSFADRGAARHPTYFEKRDPLSTARGIALALPIGLVLWALVIWAVVHR